MDTLLENLHFLLCQYKRLENHLKAFDNESVKTQKKLKNLLSRIFILNTLYNHIDKFGVTRFARDLYDIESELKWLFIKFDLDWEIFETSNNLVLEN